MPTRWEKFEARVVANNDDEKRGRIKVVCADYTGDPEAVLPVWVEPAHDWGWFYVPDIDEVVDVEILTEDEGDEVPGECMILDPTVRWMSKRHWDANADKEPRPVPEDFTAENYGKRRGFSTPAGHIFIVDDTEGKESMRLTWKAKGKEEYAFLNFDKDGSITLCNKAGSNVYLNAKDGEATWMDQHGNTLTTTSRGILLLDKFGNAVEMKDGVIQVLGQAAVTVSSKQSYLKSGEVMLGEGADLELPPQPALRGQEVYDHYAAHTHPTGTGPSGTPTVPPPATMLSALVKLK